MSGFEELEPDDVTLQMLAGLKSAPKHVKDRFKRNLRRTLENIPTTTAEMWKSSSVPNRAFLTHRNSWLQLAGWDPAGWSIMEWSRLPEKLRVDLDRVFAYFRQDLVDQAQKILKSLDSI